MNKKLFVVQEKEKCTCDKESSSHSCPFQSDIHNNPDYTCNCCRYCTRQCAEDI